MATAKRPTTGEGDGNGRKSSTGSASSATDGGAHRELPKPKVAATTRQTPGGALERLAGRDDGWLRLAPDGDGNQCYIKWKFTGRQFPNKYVMVMIAWEDVADGLELLEEKINEVYAGVRRPVEDKWYQTS